MRILYGFPPYVRYRCYDAAVFRSVVSGQLNFALSAREIRFLFKPETPTFPQSDIHFSSRMKYTSHEMISRSPTVPLLPKATRCEPIDFTVRSPPAYGHTCFRRISFARATLFDSQRLFRVVNVIQVLRDGRFH